MNTAFSFIKFLSGLQNKKRKYSCDTIQDKRPKIQKGKTGRRLNKNKTNVTSFLHPLKLLEEKLTCR